MAAAKVFVPKSNKPLPLSRNKIELFVDCPRCFYLDLRKEVGRHSTRSSALITSHAPMPTKPPPELLPFLDALAELLANQIIKELRMSPEQANAETTSDAPPQMKNGVAAAPLNRKLFAQVGKVRATKGLPKGHQGDTKRPPKG